jgi:hypothetical protein
MAAIQSALDAQRIVEEKGLHEALFYVGFQTGVCTEAETWHWLEIKNAIIEKHK